jgi:hypothetical protein
MKSCFSMFAVVAGLLLPACALAQNYIIDWYKISGGGGACTGGVYTLNGTIGQHDASRQLTGGAYSLTGGFWAIYAIQSPGAPLLTITYVGKNAVVSWDPTVTGWTLQTNVNLATPATWGNYLGTIANNSATNKPPPNDLFFRLKGP